MVVGASAGGVEALKTVVAGLPRELPAAVLVVLHVRASRPSGLPEILERAGALPAFHPADGESLLAGRIYVAPPDRHLLVQDARVQVVRGPQENRHRPAIDPLFRSAAIWYGDRVVGVVLTGADDDGSAGAAAVSRGGGRVVVQDPGDAAYATMPRHAIAADSPARIVPLEQIANVVIEFVNESAKLNGDQMSDSEDLLHRETRYAALDHREVTERTPPGELVPYSCPACGGSLWRTPDNAVERVRCRVGHAYTLDALVDGQSEMVENALWTALRSLEERASLTERVASRLRSRGLDARADEYETASQQTREHAALLEKVLLGGNGEHRRA